MREWVLPVACALSAILLAGCSGSKSPKAPGVSGSDVSYPKKFVRPRQDGAPWWDVDVSKIPDAVPTPHNGAFKRNPYTVMGKTYYPLSTAHDYRSVGTASWYGTKFHGQATANGETYDLYGMTAAHKTLPLPSYVRVINLDSGKSVIVRVNDRGPFYSDRVIDLSFAAAKKLGFAETGTARVKVEGIDPSRWWAERGQPAPMVLAQPKRQVLSKRSPILEQTIIETYMPPATQHAAAVLAQQIDSKKNASLPVDGLYLQVGAFINPDAAELLKEKLSRMTHAPVFISSVTRDHQVLHRVRLGPMGSEAEVDEVQNIVRVAELGEPARVKPD